jgi:hypothetical protein
MNLIGGGGGGEGMVVVKFQKRILNPKPPKTIRLYPEFQQVVKNIKRC